MLAILLAILCILAFLHLFSKQKESFSSSYTKAFDKEHYKAMILKFLDEYQEII